MIDREKVMEGLQGIDAYFRESFDAMAGTLACELFYKWAEAAEQAIALLKEQEPRVMTLEEVKQERICWIEDKDAEILYPAIYKCRGNGMFAVFAIEQVYDFEHGNEDISRQFDEGERWLEEDDLNEWWRPWTSRPTDAQREAVKWE